MSKILCHRAGNESARTVNKGPSYWVRPRDTSSIQLTVVKEKHQIGNLLDLCTLSRGPDGRTQKLDLTPDMEKYSELIDVPP